MPADHGSSANLAASQFGRRLMRRRENAGLSPAQAAAKTGFTVAYIAEVEAGLADPTLDEMVALADGIGAKVWELLSAEP